MGGGGFPWLPRYKMTSKYGSFSPKNVGTFFVVQIRFRLFLRLKKKYPNDC